MKLGKVFETERLSGFKKISIETENETNNKFSAALYYKDM